MSKKTLIILCAVIAIGALAYAFFNKSVYTDISSGYEDFTGESANLTNEEIKQKFQCERITLELRDTDVYCDNPSLYRQHVMEDRVITHP